jgi:uracil phosphoribosyltransferase
VLLDHGVKEEKILFLTLIGTATSAHAQHHLRSLVYFSCVVWCVRVRWCVNAAAPEGIRAVCAAYPEVGIVVSEVDPGLNEKVSPPPPVPPRHDTTRQDTTRHDTTRHDR